MSDTRIQSGATEPIQLFAVGANGNPLSGLTDLYVRVRRGDGLLLDWSDYTFKAAGWTTLNCLLAEADGVNAPGLYEVTGGLNTSSITNAVANDYYTVVPLQTPGNTARLPAPGQIAVGKWADRLDANVSTRATQAQILSDATPFAGADIAAILADTSAMDARLPVDPADESNIQAAIATVKADTAAILIDTSAIDARLPVDPADESNVLAAIAAVPGGTWDALRVVHTVAGSFGESVRVTAAGLATDAANEIADTVWDEPNATHLDPGSMGEKMSRLDVAVSTRAAPGAAMSLVHSAIDADVLDATGIAKIADGVWDEDLSGHLGAGSTGQAQARVDVAVSSRAAPGAQMALVTDAVTSASLAASAVAELADGVWEEPLIGHIGAGTTGEALSRVDVAVSTRAPTGAQMALTPAAIAGVSDGVWDELLAGHLAVGSTGKALQDAGAVSDPNVIAAAVWDRTSALHVAPGTMGQLENRLDAAVSTRATPGAPMDLISNAVDADALAASAVTEIQAAILSDATPFPGGRIDVAISSRAAPGAAMDLVANAIDATSIDTTGSAKLADAVWDEPLAGHTGVGTAGKVLSDGSNPAAIAGAVWDEALAGHAGAGTAGEAQARVDVLVSTRAAPGAAMDLVTDAVDAAALATTGVQEIRNGILSDGVPFQGARIDAAISSRAAPGAAMTLAANAVDGTSVATSGASKIGSATWDVVAAAHASPGTTGALLDHLDADMSSRAAAGDAMGLTPGALSAAAGAVWDETLAGHLSTGSTGAALDSASQAVDPGEVAVAVWDEPRASHVIPGTMGEAQEQSTVVAAQVEKIDNAATVAPSSAVPGSLLDRLCNKSVARTYDQTTDSLEGIRDRIG